MTYMTGTLAVGDLGTMGTVAGGYTEFKADISNLFITHEGAALGSAALAILEHLGLPALDFDLAFSGAAARAIAVSRTCSTAAASAPADSAARCPCPSRPRSFSWDSAAWRCFATPGLTKT